MAETNLMLSSSTFPSGTTAASARYSAFIEKRLIEWGNLDTQAFERFMEPKKLDKGYSFTYQINRKRRIKIPMSGATESVTPANTPLDLDRVTGTSTQYVLVAAFSDVDELVALHSMLEQAVSSVAEAMQRLSHFICSQAYLAGTNVYYAGGKTSRNALTTADVFDTDTLRKMIVGLKLGDGSVVGGATAWNGTYFGGICDPSVAASMRKDPTWEAVNIRQHGGELLEKGIVNYWEQLEIHESNNLPRFTNVSDGATGAGWTQPTSATGFFVVADNAAASGSLDAAGGINGFKSVSTVNAAGGLAINTTYNAVIVRRNQYRGYPEDITSILKVATNNTANHKELDLTMPTDTAGTYVYDVYFGTDGGTLYLYSAGNAGGAVVTVTSVPSSGTTAPQAPGWTSAGTRVTVLPLWAVGKNALARLTLDSLQSFITPGTPSDTDPAVQRKKVAAKFHLGSFVIYDAFFARMEMALAF